MPDMRRLFVVKRKTVKQIGIYLQLVMLAAILTLLYLQVMNYFWWELGLVVAMFGISMCMLFLSEKEDEERSRERARGRG
jgi:hypothetical protein